MADTREEFMAEFIKKMDERLGLVPIDEPVIEEEPEEEEE